MGNKTIKIRKFLTNSEIDFRRDFYKYLDELFKTTDIVEMTESEWIGYFMKKFKGGCNPMQLTEELKRLQ